MELKEIYKLIDKITEKGITEFEMERDGFRIRVQKEIPKVSGNNASPSAHVAEHKEQGQVPAANDASAAPAEEKKPDKDYHVVTSPMVGTFYRSPSPNAKPYISVGDTVKRGQVCCIVEAMKIMNEIQVDVEGVVAEIHAVNEQPVEFGEPLFSVESV